MNFEVLAVNANPLLNLVHAGEFTPGAVNRVAAMAVAAEGKGVNVARVLARHGHAVVLTGFAGGHSGAWLRELVRAEGVADAFVQTAATLRVGFMAGGAEGHPTTVFPGGFPVTSAECAALLEQVEKLLGSVRLVIASGSVRVVKQGRLLSLLHQGDCFGEMAHLSGKDAKRSTDVISKTEVMLIEITSEALARATANCRYQFSEAFLELLVRRLSLANTRISRLLSDHGQEQ